MKAYPAAIIENPFSRDPKARRERSRTGSASPRAKSRGLSRAQSRGGFTLVEILISMSITAMLMLAMGAAFSAATGSVQNNDEYFRSVQQSRVALDLIMGEIRRCSAITSASSTSLTLTAAAGDPGNFAGGSITFAFSNGQLTMTSGATTTPIAKNVTGAVFNYAPSTAIPSEVSLAITVQVGADPVTISNSAAPRYLMTTQWN